MSGRTIHIVEGVKFNTARWSLKMELEVYGKIDVCHMGDRSNQRDHPTWVKFQSREGAEKAMEAMERGRVFCNCERMRGEWREEAAAPPPVRDILDDPNLNLTSRDLMKAMMEGKSGKKRSRSRSRRKRSKSRRRKRSRSRSRSRKKKSRSRSRRRGRDQLQSSFPNLKKEDPDSVLALENGQMALENTPLALTNGGQLGLGGLAAHMPPAGPVDTAALRSFLFGAKPLPKAAGAFMGAAPKVVEEPPAYDLSNCGDFREEMAEWLAGASVPQVAEVTPPEPAKAFGNPLFKKRAAAAGATTPAAAGAGAAATGPAPAPSFGNPLFKKAQASAAASAPAAEVDDAPLLPVPNAAEEAALAEAAANASAAINASQDAQASRGAMFPPAEIGSASSLLAAAALRAGTGSSSSALLAAAAIGSGTPSTTPSALLAAAALRAGVSTGPAAMPMPKVGAPLNPALLAAAALRANAGMQASATSVPELPASALAFLQQGSGPGQLSPLAARLLAAPTSKAASAAAPPPMATAAPPSATPSVSTALEKILNAAKARAENAVKNSSALSGATNLEEAEEAAAGVGQQDSGWTADEIAAEVDALKDAVTATHNRINKPAEEFAEVLS